MTDREAQTEAYIIHHKDNNSCGSCLEKSRRAPTRFNYSQGYSSDGERREGRKSREGCAFLS